MNATTDSTAVLITRTISAPRERVFAAWASEESLVQWFAPDGCAIAYRHFDFREGSGYHSCIRTPDGYECWCKGAFLKIVPLEKIVMTMAIANAEGEVLTAEQAGMHHEWPQETVVTVTFVDAGGGTELTLHQTVSEALAKETGAYPSWLEMLDKLEKELQGEGQ